MANFTAFKSRSVNELLLICPQLDQSNDQQLELQQQQQQPADQELKTNSEEQHQEHLDNEQKLAQGVSVSMPSLDDDADGNQPSSSDQVPMDLEDIQNAAESGQIKFILDENGQMMQSNIHILTTDADSNQIFVQDSVSVPTAIAKC
ncbi:uncharacterized protein LOC129576551 [Sitodiplosis mosellana]|uniref:uncharacterized protein LOC129576551 n=1 Tax=Sitodiplosis mosellana TaxID=263140 RepID=UPI002443B961|nr:uncharacterized protein LOC129576551 [Sitodiplosis mosellana]